jgi:Integrase core domain
MSTSRSSATSRLVAATASTVVKSDGASARPTGQPACSAPTAYHHPLGGSGYVHAAVDDHSRLAYVEVLGDEQAATACGFWTRAYAWFSERGIVVQRVLTDNGACYRSRSWRVLLGQPAGDPPPHPTVSAGHQRQGGAVQPDLASGMGLWAPVLVRVGASGCLAGLAAPV